MKYNYSTDVAAGACPGCGQAVILYHHVRLTPGEKQTKLTVLDSIFCRECIATMAEPQPSATIGMNHRAAVRPQPRPAGNADELGAA